VDIVEPYSHPLESDHEQGFQDAEADVHGRCSYIGSDGSSVRAILLSADGFIVVSAPESAVDDEGNISDDPCLFE